jgi:hypothetical protein
MNFGRSVFAQRFVRFAQINAAVGEPEPYFQSGVCAFFSRDLLQ